MNPNNTFILFKTKQLLAQRYGQFSIRLIIHLLENADSTNSKILQLKTKSLSKAKKSDISELIGIDAFGISFTRLEPSNIKYSIYLFRCDTFTCRVEIPMSFERKGDVRLDEKIRTIWDYYLKIIGCDKKAWKRVPTLTTSRGGRYWALKQFLKQNPDFSVKQAFLVIDGAVRSPFHMGFNQKNGEKLPKHYCDICNIFTNLQRAEELMAKSDAEHYSIQLTNVNNKNSKTKNIESLKLQTSQTISSELTDEEWLGL